VALRQDGCRGQTRVGQSLQRPHVGS
jgi:hypothetical protein